MGSNDNLPPEDKAPKRKMLWGCLAIIVFVVLMDAGLLFLSFKLFGR